MIIMMDIIMSIVIICLGMKCLVTEGLGWIETEGGVVDFCSPDTKQGMTYGCDTYGDIATCTINNITLDIIKEINNENITALFICFDVKAANMHVNRYILPLAELHRLRKLYIKSSDQSIMELTHDCRNNCRFNLEEITINLPIVNITADDNILSLLKGTLNIMVLDLSFTLCTNIATVFEFVGNYPGNFNNIKELRLQNAQSIECKLPVNNLGSYESISLNFTELLHNESFINLTLLDIRRNNIVSFSSAIYNYFPNLKQFFVSNNFLQEGKLYELFLLPGLEQIDISNQQNQFCPLSKRIDLNTPSPFSFSYWESPPHCCEGGCGWLYSLKLASNNELFCEFMKCVCGRLCEDMHCSHHFPYLHEVANPFSGCINGISIPFSKTLISVSMDNVGAISFLLKTKQFNYSDDLKVCFGENSIRELIISNNHNLLYYFNLAASKLPEGKLVITTGLERLEVFNFSGNHLRFEQNKICHSKQSFSNSLTHVYGSDNEFQFSDNYKPCLTCAKYLIHLDYSKNNLLKFPELAFTSCSSLEYISLAGNKIDFLETFFDLSDAHNLSELDVSHNSIQMLSEQFRNHLDSLAFIKERSNKTLTINLEGNPMNCSCHADAISFITWMQTTTIIFKNNEQYTCYGRDGFRVITQINIDEYRNKCFPSQVFIIVATTSASFGIMLIFCLIFMTYYKRFTILYYVFQFYQLLKSRKCNTKKKNNQYLYKYDVFVSYCAKDRFWVHDVLMAKLENEYNFKLCIHYRDFPAGGSISDVIVEKLNQSQEIVFVISDNFIEALGHSKRPWIQFELDEACDLGRLRKKNIIVIRLGKIARSVKDRNLAHLLDGGHIFLQWPENMKGQKVFWAKLSSDLYGDVKNSCLGCCFNTRNSIGPPHVADFSEDPYEAPSMELYTYNVNNVYEEDDETNAAEI